MPERVVDHLEVVDVDEQDRQRERVALAALQLTSDHLVEEPTVVAAGERVGDRELAELVLRFLERPTGPAQLDRHLFDHEQVQTQGPEEEHHAGDHHQLGGRRRGLASSHGHRDPGLRQSGE